MVYLDYNATTPLDTQVIQSIHTALQELWGNPSSNYETGAKCKQAVQVAREQVAEMIGSKNSDILFTSGGTESNHIVFHSILEHYRLVVQKIDSLKVNGCIGPSPKAAVHIITSNIEHDSVRLPLQHWLKQNKVDVTFVPVNQETGQVEVEDVTAAIKPNTCLISVMLANNETGVIQPVGKIGQALKNLNRGRSVKIYLHTDAAQALGKIPVDVEDLSVDYLTIVGHKFYGPRIGALFVRDLANKSTPLYPVFHGGGQERGFRPGTENTAMIVGLGKASYLVSHNLDEYAEKMKTTREYFEASLVESFGDGVVFNKHSTFIDKLPNTCSVAFVGSDLKGSEILSKVPEVQASTGSACHSGSNIIASAVLLASGVEEKLAKCTIRFSVGRETTKEDIDIVVRSLKQAL